MKRILFFILIVIVFISCNNNTSNNNNEPVNNGIKPPTNLGIQILAMYPHDTTSFTEGFEVRDTILYESTGLKDKSKLLKTGLHDGKVLRQINLAKEYFGEGITILNGKIYQLTWEEHKCFVYDFKTFDKLGEFEYEGEGWGMTNDGKHLIMDSGNNNLFFRDPETFKIVNTIGVIDNNGPVAQINELEYVDGFIYANIWMTNYLVKIDPVSGHVIAKADLTDLIGRYVPSTLPAGDEGSYPNGIAYDKINNQFLITGKLWPKIFAVRFF